jgi:ribose transport system permease protein
MTYRFFTPALISRIGILVLVFVLFTLGNPGFASLDNVFAIMEGFALTGLVAAGIASTMLVGELDLSVGSVAAVAGIIAVNFSGLGLVPAVLIAVAAATAFGIAQGWIIARTGINSLVFTIATLILMRGLAFMLTPEATVMPLDRIGMSDFLVMRIGIFSPFSLVTLLIVAVLGLFFAYTRWGREMMAFGGARNEARAAGVNTRRPIIVAFAISASLAALAGSLASIKSAAAAPFSFEGLLLAGVTAALVGGVSLYGGRGTMFGVVVGVLILRALTAGIASRGAAIYIEALATGMVLLVVLIVEFLTESPQRRAWSERRAFERQLTSNEPVNA